ncbi:APC family permease [Micromonospora sp. CPCC 206060]|uniref:APC family permease n=1 Tax=Micromonospora sp. CPCC 206060 TaxID=3122406 RepID=UPI002FF3023B
MSTETTPSQTADPLTATGTRPAPNTLRPNAVGVGELVFFVLSCAAPLTGMAGMVGLVFLLAGPIVPAGYLIAGAVYAIFAVGFTAMSRHLRNSGAFYAYVTAGLGKVAGAGSAVMAYVAYAVGEVGFAAAAGVFASLAMTEVAGLDVPWQVSALVVAVVVSVLSYLKVNIGARVLGVLLIAEIGILFVMAVAVLVQGGYEGFSFESFNPVNLATPSVGVLFVFTFIMFIGFEQTAVYSEEARDPKRTVPRATYLSIVLLAGIFTFISWTVLMAAGPSRLESLLADDPSSLMFNLNTEYVGEAVTGVMQLLIVTSFIAGVLAVHNASTRYLYSLGREQLIPAAFGRTDPRTLTPSVAGVVHAAAIVVALIAFGLTSLDPYTQIIVWTNTPTLVGVMALEILTSVAVIRYLGRNRSGGETLWQRLIAPGLATVLLGAVLLLVISQMKLLTGLGAVGNSIVLAPLVLGFIIGAIRAGRMRHTPAPTTAELTH